MLNGAGEVGEVSYYYYSRDSREIVRKFPCMEVAKFTDRDLTFLDVFRRCAWQKVNPYLPGYAYGSSADRDRICCVHE